MADSSSTSATQKSDPSRQDHATAEVANSITLPVYGPPARQQKTVPLLHEVNGVPSISLTTPDTGSGGKLARWTRVTGHIKREDGAARSGLVVPIQLVRGSILHAKKPRVRPKKPSLGPNREQQGGLCDEGSIPCLSLEDGVEWSEQSGLLLVVGAGGDYKSRAGCGYLTVRGGLKGW